MRWLFAIAAAAVVGSAVYAAGLGTEAAYIVRAIVRHLVAYGL